jgi:hypothetical protein
VVLEGLPCQDFERSYISMDSRVLTISSLLPYKNLSGKYTKVPFIRLQGRRLEKLGFEIGKKITVEESYGQLVLKVQE